MIGSQKKIISQCKIGSLHQIKIPNGYKRHSNKLIRMRTQDFSFMSQLQNRKDLKSKLGLILKTIQNELYFLMEDPTSSLAAYIVQYFILICIIVAIVDLFLASIISDDNSDYQNFSSAAEQILFVIFVVEYCLRLICSTAFDKKFKDFLFSSSCIIDLMAILPLIIQDSLQSSSYKEFKVIRAVRFLRIFKIFKVSKYMKGINLLTETIQQSFIDILMLICVFLLIVLSLSCIVYYWETGSNLQTNYPEQINTFSESIWWCIVTMTTVGYGDKIPQTIPGRIIACIAAFLGTSTISLYSYFKYLYQRPVAILGINFSEALKHQNEKGQIKKIKEYLFQIMDNQEEDSQDMISNDPEEDNQKNINEILNKREIQFMEKRVEIIYQNTRKLMEMSETSQSIFYEVTNLLKGLYTALSQDIDLHLEDKLSKMNTKKRAMKIQKTIREQKQFDVKQVMNRYIQNQGKMEINTRKEQEDIDNEEKVQSKRQVRKKSLQPLGLKSIFEAMKEKKKGLIFKSLAVPSNTLVPQQSQIFQKSMSSMVKDVNEFQIQQQVSTNVDSRNKKDYIEVQQLRSMGNYVPDNENDLSLDIEELEIKSVEGLNDEKSESFCQKTPQQLMNQFENLKYKFKKKKEYQLEGLERSSFNK